MADWSLPQLSDLKVDVLSMLKGREVDAYTLAENALNPPVGAIRWNRTLNMFQSWDGAAWHDLIIAVVGGGTGGSNIDEVLDSLNLGTMSTQNSNAVNITGGSITGVSPLSTTGNLTVGGVITAGSTPTTITNSAGQILESAIVDGTIYARVNAQENITQIWTYHQPLQIYASGAIHFLAGSLRFHPNETTSGLDRITFADGATSTCPAYIQAYEAGVSANNFIIGNNYHSSDGANSGRRNTALGASLIRLGQGAMVLASIDAAGTYSDLLSLNPGGVTSYPPNLQIGTGVATVSQLTLFGAVQGSLTFYAGGVMQSAIYGASKKLYYDADDHYWRSTTGAVSYATLSSAGTFAAYVLQTNSGYINSGAVAAFYMPPSHTQAFCNTFYLTNTANTNTWGHFTPNFLCLTGDSTEVRLGSSAIGAALRLIKVGANGYLDCVTAGGTFYFRRWNDSAVLLTLHNEGTLQPANGVYLSNGTVDAPAVRFVATLNSGIYYNAAGSTLEFGARMSEEHRGIVRCHTAAGGGRVSIYIGTQEMFYWGPWPNVRVQGHFAPVAVTAYYCGEPTLYWYQSFSYHGYVTISDIRAKDVKGPIRDDILDFIDAVEPIIASSKASEKPVGFLGEEEFIHDFATFSAQDIREKIDEPLGIKTVFGRPEKLGVEYGRLTPLLWQAIRRLNARLKALENN